MDQKKTNKILGLTMALIGFAMIVFNALNYIFGWDFKNPAFTVLGLVFVLIGLKQTRSKQYDI
jgi:hypothetical protein